MSQPAPPMKPLRPRRRFTWLKALVILAIVLGIIFGYRYWRVYLDTTQLSNYLAELEKTDPQWQLAHLLRERKPLPAGTDAAAEVIALQQLLTIHEGVPMNNRNAWWAMQRNLYDKHGLEQWETFRGIYPNAQVPPAIREKLTALYTLAPAPEVFERAKKLRHLEHGQYQHVLKPLMLMSLLPDVQGSRGVTNHLGYLAQLRGETGQVAEAIEFIQGTFGITRSFENDPFYISHLVRMAIAACACRDIEQLLAQKTPLTEAQLQVLQAEVVREQKLTENLLQWMVRCERTGIDHDLAQLQEGRITWGEMSRTLGRSLQWRTNIPAVDDTLVSLIPELMVGWGNRPKTLARERLTLLQFFAAAMSWARLPEDQLRSGLAKLEEDGPQITPFLRAYSFMSGWYGDRGSAKREYAMLSQMLKLTLNCRARLRAALAILACEQFRLAQGRLPTNWQEIVPGYLSTVPIDPYTGKPMLFKTLPDGIVIYAVGPDDKDSGGMVHITEDVVAQDVGYKLWETKHRAIQMNDAWERYLKKKATDE